MDGEKGSEDEKNVSGTRARAVCVLGRVRASTELSDFNMLLRNSRHVPFRDRSSRPVVVSLRACAKTPLPIARDIDFPDIKNVGSFGGKARITLPVD